MATQTDRGGPPEGRRFVFTRTFDAPRDLVFKAWTEPERMAAWWGPAGFSNPTCELDVRPGGAIRIDMRAPDGMTFPMKGRFEEVVEPERLVFVSTAMENEAGEPGLEAHNTVTFTEEGGRTRLVITAVVTKVTPEAMAALEGMETGWTQSLDKLERYLAGQSGGSA